MMLQGALESALATALALPPAVGAPSPGAFLAYGAVALLCVLAARREGAPAGRGTPQRMDIVQPKGRMWSIAGAGLLLLGLDSLVHGDRLFVLWMRDLAHEQGWYEHRRVLQTTVLAASLALAFIAVRRGWTHRLRDGLPRPPALLRTGLALLVMLHALRWVSLHYTDLMLDLHIAGGSAGRWLELLALALAGAAALGRTRAAPVGGLREFPHV